MPPFRVSLIAVCVALAACAPRSKGLVEDAAPRLVGTEAVESRYGLVTQDGERQFVRFGDRVLLSSEDPDEEQFTFVDVRAVGNRDLLAVRAGWSPDCGDRLLLLELGPSGLARRVPGDGQCGFLVASARTPGGVTHQIKLYDGRRVAFVCYDYAPGAPLGVRPCPAPLTRGDDLDTPVRPRLRRLRLGNCRTPYLEVASVTGEDSADARLRARHTSETALDFCEWEVEAEGPQYGPAPARVRACVRRELAGAVRSYGARADCTRRTLVGLDGRRYRYVGHGQDEGGHFYDRWIDEAGKQANDSCAGAALALRDQFVRLCPRRSGFLLLE